MKSRGFVGFVKKLSAPRAIMCNTRKKNGKNKVENKTKAIGENVENILDENQQYRKGRREEPKSNIMKKNKEDKKNIKNKNRFSQIIYQK